MTGASRVAAGAFVVESPWIRRVVRSAPALRLVCFPYAGAGASVFRTWSALLPDTIEVVAVQLPGREDRSREPAPADLRALVRSCAVALRPYLSMPFAFYGHCAGALLAYEVARVLGTRFGAWPVRLLAGAQAAPRFGVADVPPGDLADDEFLAAVCARGGVPDALLSRPEFVAFLLPVLRADFALWDRYADEERQPIPCPVTALRGREDRFVDAGHAMEWGGHTSAGCEVREVDGDHYFVNGMGESTARVLADVLLAGRERWGDVRR